MKKYRTDHKGQYEFWPSEPNLYLQVNLGISKGTETSVLWLEARLKTVRAIIDVHAIKCWLKLKQGDMIGFSIVCF